MNYGQLKDYLNDELATTFSATTYTRWTDIVNGWLRRDQVNNNLISQGSVAPTANPFQLAGATVNEVLDLWYMDGARQVQLTPVSQKRLRDWTGVSGAKPRFYRILNDGQIEVAPYLDGYTFYYTVIDVDGVMSTTGSQSTALLFQPGLVLAAYKRCAYRYNKDPEGVVEAEADYQNELAAYRVSEAMKSAGTAAAASGAWGWH